MGTGNESASYSEKPNRSDLISRQAVLDIVLLDPGITDWQLKMIKDLPSTQPEQRWIPCEERLPEEEGDYIVTIKVHTIDDDWYPDVNYFRYNPKRKPNGWGTYYEDDIIAWMDKPAPYTQE